MRKAIQIAIDGSEEATEGEYVYCLCDDGTIWLLGEKGEWLQLPSPPPGDDPF